MYIENIVIGKPIVTPESIFSSSHEDWIDNEEPKTLFTEERFLPKALVQAGIAKSANEIRRNRPDLVRVMNELAYEEIKIGKRMIFLLVGK